MKVSIVDRAKDLFYFEKKEKKGKIIGRAG